MQIQVVIGLEIINFMLILQIYTYLMFTDGIKIIENDNYWQWSCNNINLAITAMVLKYLKNTQF